MAMNMPTATSIQPTGADDHHDATLKLTDEQLRLPNITLAEVKGGDLRRHFLVPGAIVPSADRIARVSVRLLGTVAELRKRLGDTVAQGEIVAVIESREVADAKSEYLAALSTNALEQTMLDRSQSLYETKTTSENTFLRTRATAEQAKIKLDGARQKLAALGLGSAEIAALPNSRSKRCGGRNFARRLRGGGAAAGGYRLAGRPRRPGKRTVRHRRSR